MAGLDDSPLDCPIRATQFKSQAAQTKQDKRLSLRQLADIIEKTDAESKGALPWMKLAVFGDKPTPLRPRSDGGERMTGNSLRHDANVTAVTGVEADYDAGKMSALEARQKLFEVGITGLVYDTPSSTPEHPRFRVFAPFSAELAPAERLRHMARLNGVLGGTLDDASFTLSQAYYFGNVTGRPRVATFLVEGTRYIDEADDLDATAIGRRGKTKTDDAWQERGAFDEAAHLKAIWTGEVYHYSAIALAGHWSATDVSPVEAFTRMRAAFNMVPEEDRDARWADRFAKLPEIISYAFGKRAEEAFAERDRLADLLKDEDVGEADEDEGEEAGRLSFFSPGECSASEHRQYVVKGLVAEGDIACIVGAPGVGKSLIGPRIGFAVAQGETIFGMRTKQGGVFYVAAEDEHGMKARISALLAEHGEAEAFKLVCGVSDLFSKGSADLLALRVAVKRERPALVFIDTLAMAFPGLEENTAEGMGRVVAAAHALTKWGSAVVLIHHDTKDGASGLPRGHSVLNGALDVSVLLTKGQDGIVRGKLTKNRNGSCERDLAFAISTCALGTDGDGDLVTAALCKELDAAAAPKTERMSDSVKAAYSIFHDLLETEGLVRNGQRGVREDSWRKACVDGRTVCAVETSDSRRKAFDRAVGKLMRTHKVVEFKDGVYWLANSSRGAAEDFSGAPHDQDNGLV